MSAAQTAVLLAALLTSGLTAGLFAGFSYAVMPGLRRSSARTLVEAMQGVNVAIINPLFMSLFMGGLLVSIASVFVLWGTDARWWVLGGAVSYLVMFVVTSALNVPLNNALDAAGDPDANEDLDGVREGYEAPWTLWNNVRAVANTISFVCFALALLVFAAG